MHRASNPREASLVVPLVAAPLRSYSSPYDFAKSMFSAGAVSGPSRKSVEPAQIHESGRAAGMPVPSLNTFLRHGSPQKRGGSWAGSCGPFPLPIPRPSPPEKVIAPASRLGPSMWCPLSPLCLKRRPTPSFPERRRQQTHNYAYARQKTTSPR